MKRSSKLQLTGGKFMRVLWISLLLLSFGCKNQVEVIPKIKNKLETLTKMAISNQASDLIGAQWYAGRYAEKDGFTRTEKAILKDVVVKNFDCSLQRIGAWYSLKRKTTCKAQVIFKFKGKKKSKNYVSNLKVEVTSYTSRIVFKNDFLKEKLSFGFVKKNPFSKRIFSKYWKVLKKGKLAVGMPLDYLKICWGEPIRVFNKSIDKSGTRETFVYDRYFVLLQDGIVSSIHKFDS
jgi:hypothetical protein